MCSRCEPSLKYEPVDAAFVDRLQHRIAGEDPDRPDVQMVDAGAAMAEAVDEHQRIDRAAIAFGPAARHQADDPWRRPSCRR